LVGVICAGLRDVGVTAVLLNRLEIVDLGLWEFSERAWVEEGSISGVVSEVIFIFCKRLMK